MKKRIGPIHETCLRCGGDGWVMVPVRGAEGEVIDFGAAPCPGCKRLRAKRAKR